MLVTENPKTGEQIPGKVMLLPEYLQFGVLKNANEMAGRRYLRADHNNALLVNFDLTKRRVEIGFSYQLKNLRDGPSGSTGGSNGLDAIRHFKAQIVLNNITRIFSIQHTDEKMSIVIVVPSPPLFFKKREDIGDTHSSRGLHWGEDKTWQRITDLMYDTKSLNNTKTAFVKADQDIDIGRCLAYQFFIPKRENQLWGKLQDILKDFNVDIVSTESINLSPSGFKTDPKLGDAPGLWNSFGHDATPRGALAALRDDNDYHLPFAVRYQLEVCISQGVLVDDNITKEFLVMLSSLAKTHRYLSNPAADLLTYISDKGQVVYDPMSVFKDRRAFMYRPYFRLPEYCEWVRKVTVTPTTMYMSSPIPETTNRVLRQYRKYADRFLRVQFTEEKTLGRLYEDTDSRKKAAIFDRIHRTLKNGIELAGRHYEFLAFGNSQFREQGAYFFHPTSDLTCEHIRSWMGDFSHIKVVAKFAARMGQCLSTTRTVNNLPAGADIKMIPDIEDENGCCFSDGVGRISAQLADDIARSLGMFNKGQVPSAFQFRLGGSKGLLVAWPFGLEASKQPPLPFKQPLLAFNQLQLRPSQMKFSAGSKSIEIVKGSRYSVATLNRQTITILRSLGVADEVFMEMAIEQDAEYRKAMKDEATALDLLQRHSDPNGTNEILAAMVRSGFMRGNEPSMMALLSSWLAWCLKQLKEKARLIVQNGAFLFGCVDETNTLRGWRRDARRDELPQIFVQVPNDNGAGGWVVKTGICVVGRNPSLHPGDLRVVEAVDVPALKHIRDVVVFPAQGDQDIPSMCSGGDLDGDDYFVIWDDRLRPWRNLWNVRPMDDEVAKPLELNRDVQISDIQDFFVEHIKNNSLSMIAQSHLAQADQHGARDRRCTELAKLHSKAVDYIKSGQPARLTPNLRAWVWPHFMEKPWNKEYHSTTALGQIYDYVENIRVNVQYLEFFDLRILQRYNLTGDELLKARALKMQYDTTLTRIMAQRDIDTEFEIFTTFALTRTKIGSDYKRHEDIGSLRSTLHDRFAAAVAREAGTPQTDREPYRRLVAACYRVTWEHVQRAQSGSNIPVPCITFPWIFYRVLCSIATEVDKSELVETGAETETEADLMDLQSNVGGDADVEEGVGTKVKTKNVRKKLELSDPPVVSDVWDRDITDMMDRLSKEEEKPEKPVSAKDIL
ncbi:hypothetical protein SLS62_001479 [Diatrype stigma]|uniref:RNA-dependent RNA polymerase n=1 Tax=Diatrype stigma TaxID=117547 RepID=A0AAN9V098_9PEZI